MKMTSVAARKRLLEESQAKKQKKSEKKTDVFSEFIPDLNNKIQEFTPSVYNVKARILCFVRTPAREDKRQTVSDKQYDYKCQISFNFPYYNAEEGRKDTYDYNVLYKMYEYNGGVYDENDDQKLVLCPKSTLSNHYSIVSLDKELKKRREDKAARIKDCERVRNKEVRLKMMDFDYLKHHLHEKRISNFVEKRLKNIINPKEETETQPELEEEHTKNLKITWIDFNYDGKYSKYRGNAFKITPYCVKLSFTFHSRYAVTFWYNNNNKTRFLHNYMNTSTKIHRLNQIQQFKELVVKGMTQISNFLFLPSTAQRAPMLLNNVIENRFVNDTYEKMKYRRDKKKYFTTVEDMNKLRSGDRNDWVRASRDQIVLKPEYTYKLKNDAVLQETFWRNMLVVSYDPDYEVRLKKNFYLTKSLEELTLESTEHRNIRGKMKISPMPLGYKDLWVVDRYDGDRFFGNRATAEKTFVLQSNTFMPLSKQGFFNHIGVATMQPELKF